MERVHITISGRVQGVWFRASTMTQALRLGLVGWVCNRRNGQVEVMAEGPRSALDALVAWCQHGPEMATVVDVSTDWQLAAGGLDDFEIGPTF